MKKTLTLFLLLLLNLTLLSAYDCWYNVEGEGFMKVTDSHGLVQYGDRILIGCSTDQKNSWPGVLSLYDSGSFSIKPPRSPDNNFGKTIFLGPTYWVNNSYIENIKIKSVNINSDKTFLTFYGENRDFKIKYTIQIFPSSTQIIALVTQEATAKRKVTLDNQKLKNGESFHIFNTNLYEKELFSYYNGTKIKTISIENMQNNYLFNPALIMSYKKSFTISDIYWKGLTYGFEITKSKNPYLQGYSPDKSYYYIWPNDRGYTTILKGQKIVHKYTWTAV